MLRLQVACLLVLSSIGCRSVPRNCPSPPKPIEVSVSATYAYEDGAVSVTIRR